MIFAIILDIVLMIIYLISHGYKKENNVDKVHLYSMAVWIIDTFKKYGINLCSEKNARFIRNSNVIGGNESNLSYTVKKVIQSIIVMFAASVLAIAYGSINIGDTTIQTLKRPAYNSEEESVTFFINDVKTTMEIKPKIYDEEEIKENFVKAYEELLIDMCGKNSSLDCVKCNLTLPNYNDEYNIGISWSSSDDEIIDYSGTVNNRYFDADQQENVILTATMTCQDYTCIYDIDVRVLAQDISDTLRIIRKVEAYIQNENINNRITDSIELPDEVFGNKIFYKKDVKKYDYLFAIGGIIIGIVIFVGRDDDLKKLEDERRKQMLLDYPDIISKLTILLQAGMSVRRALEKIVEDYMQQEKTRYAYEEMKLTVNEIRTGALEGIAYAEFGRRCDVKEYLKLGTMLEQNVKSGTKGLLNMLETEVYIAFDNKKNEALKCAAEADTKLLFPMIVMLMIVLVIIMTPALMSFGF